MLSQERYKLILEKLDKESVVYLNDLVKYLNTSESTIRRDLTALDKLGLLRKVHGGATSIKDINITTIDDKVENRQGLNINEKILIAEFAASLIKDNDFVYIDAGTTTELMIDFITNTKAVFVTNGIVHARKLIQKNCITYILSIRKDHAAVKSTVSCLSGRNNFQLSRCKILFFDSIVLF